MVLSKAEDPKVGSLASESLGIRYYLTDARGYLNSLDLRQHQESVRYLDRQAGTLRITCNIFFAIHIVPPVTRPVASIIFESSDVGKVS